MTQRIALIGLVIVFFLLAGCTANRRIVQLSAEEKKTALEKLKMTDEDVRKLLEKRREKDVEGWYTEGCKNEPNPEAGSRCPPAICDAYCCLVCFPNPGGGCVCYYVGC